MYVSSIRSVVTTSVLFGIPTLGPKLPKTYLWGCGSHGRGPPQIEIEIFETKSTRKLYTSYVFAMQINSHTLDSVRSRVGVKNDAVKSLSFYNEAPQDELTLDEFELFSLDRLQLLRGIETLRTKGFEGNELNNKLGLVSVREMITYFLL